MSFTKMDIRANAPIVVNVGILFAILFGVFQMGLVAARAESRLDAIENGVKNLTNAVNDAGSDVREVTSRLTAIDAEGTRWSIDKIREIQARLLFVEACLRQGKRKCPSG